MRNLFKNRLFLFTLMVGFSGYSQIKMTDSLVQKIDNKDAYLVILQTISPRINNKAAAEIVKIGKAATPNLIKVLDHQDKGIAAHFLLTEIWKKDWDETICCNISNDGFTEVATIYGLKIYIENNTLYSKDEDLKQNKKNWTKLWHT